MIQHISSSLPSFKSLDFKSGLNVLIAKKESGASDRQTRNRAGKSSLIEIVHFLTGANLLRIALRPPLPAAVLEVEKNAIFRSEMLLKESFSMMFDIGGQRLRVTRSGHQRSKIHVEGLSSNSEKVSLSNSEWISRLGDEMFGLNQIVDFDRRVPTFRSLFAYFVRRQGAFATPEKQAAMQQLGDYQVALLFMLDLDWRIASDWQKVREREKTIAELKRAAGAGAFGAIVGKASDLRTELANWLWRLIGSPA